MAYVVSFSNQKGGVGKTTSCVNLAAYIALSGYKVLLVDLDSQANASSALGVFDKNIHDSIYSVLYGEPIEKCIRRQWECGFDFIPSCRDLAGAELELKDRQEREYALKRIIEQINDEYDFIFIDCAPSINLLMINALTASDAVVIPIQCEYFALEGLNQLLNTVRLVKKSLNPSLKIDGVLLTMYMQNRLAKDVESHVRELLGKVVFDTKIPRNVRVAEAPSFAKTILQYDKNCAGARAYKTLADEFISKHKE